MTRTASFVVAFAVAALPSVVCVADPVPPPLFVTNLGPAPIVELSTSPLQVSTSPSQSVRSPQVNELRQPLYPGVQQPVVIPDAQQSYEVQAVYADGHTVTIPFWNASDTPSLTIRYGPP